MVLIKKGVKFLLFIPILIIPTIYAGGYIAQFFINYDSWLRDGGSLGSAISPEFPSSAISACLHSCFTFPYGLYGVLIFLVLITLLVILVMRLGFGEKGTKDEERNFVYSEKGTYGTAGFMTEEEMKGILETVTKVKDTDGIILGKHKGKIVSLPSDTQLNQNIAVYGASGSMKSRAFVRNMIFQSVKRGNSIIVTDSKSELYNDTCIYLEKCGYTVRVLNLVSPQNSDGWNCLSEIEGSEIFAQIFSDIVIKNTSSDKGDHFGDDGEKNLLNALVLYVEQGYPPESKNMGEVYKLLTMKTERELNTLFDLLPVTHAAKDPYLLFRKAPDSVQSSIIIGLGSRLQVFQNKEICQMTSHNDINLTRPGKEKCAYFCVLSDQTSTYDFLSSLFFSFLFTKLVNFADAACPDGKLPIAVNIIGDEWPNIGTLPDFCKKISTIRSRNLHMTGLCFQNIAQLQNRYPNNQWQEILGNCDVQLFLGATDEMTATLVSNRAGDISVSVNSKSKMLGTWRISNYTPEFRDTSSVGKRKLLTTDEVLRLPINQCLIIIRGQKILKAYKFDYTKHPESKKLVKTKASKHIPIWKKNDTSYSPESEDNIQLKNLETTNVIKTDKKSILS